jgi:hypothetical protein
MWGYDWPTLLAAVIVGTLGVARMTRLVVDDDYPPMAWFRRKWDAAFNRSGWVELVHCPFCTSPYLAAATIAWAVLSDLHWTWWLFHGWLAVAYVAAMVNTRDIPPEA